MPAQTTGTEPAEAPALECFEFTRGVMGTEFRIVLYADEAADAADAADAAFDRADELESLLSDWDPESELSRLADSAGTGEWVEVSDDLWRVVSLAQEWARITGGAFDITAGPLTRLWRWADRRRISMPEDRRIEAMRAVGWRGLELDPERQALRLTRPGMRLDAGGIAKGYTADEIAAVLRAAGLPHHLVDTGGDLRLGERPPSSAGWNVALPMPTPAPGIGHVDDALSHTVLATSGDSYRHTTVDGERLSHILDPRTGGSVPGRRLVTAVIPVERPDEPLAGAVGDLLATAATVMSREEVERVEVPPDFRATIRVLEFDPTTDQWTEWTVHFNEGDR